MTGSDASKPAGGRGCAICGKPALERFRPFCSARCADIDLHRWFQGTYAIPAVEPPEEGDGTDRPNPGTGPEEGDPER